MDEPKDYHIKWTKSGRDVPYDITYLQNLKEKDRNELIYKVETDSQA